MENAREQAAIVEILKRRHRGQTLMAVRDAMRARGFAISHSLVADLERRHAAGWGAAVGEDKP